MWFSSVVPDLGPRSSPGSGVSDLSSSSSINFLGQLRHHKVGFLADKYTISVPTEISQVGVSTWAATIVGHFLRGNKSINFATYWAYQIWGDKIAKVFYNENR